MYVIAGATGNVGSAAARTLIKAGKPVTVIVRSEEKARQWREEGAEAAVLDLTDAPALTRLLTGAVGAFLMVPPNFSVPDYLKASRELISSLATAVKDSGVEHTVLLSSVGAQHDSGTGPIVTVNWGEQALRPVGRNLTFVRAAYFLENWAPVLPVVLEHGVLPTFLAPDTPIDTIATADIGAFVADSLLNPAQGHRIRHVAGPVQYTPQDIASALSDLLGKPVPLAPAPAEDATAAFTGMGFPQQAAELYAEMYAGIANGRVAFNDDAPIEHGTTTPQDVLAPLLRSH
ncbi:NmrA family NAD(P)-binding protein [Streptomyces sp. TBY4]|uniref:NmrA family NAD(P)-binding protein n=1 Tax=Streptomyces sp. TBY4 TaxID=2962030 RepID=UPI0020B75E3A|nr:NmrA family NAD(P)-binding protein [Streptomyces sp. TBY4]MCP3756991.1 NmrA family NAD(P)-binding protein [Streptomyces sp. TBY4]